MFNQGSVNFAKAVADSVYSGTGCKLQPTSVALTNLICDATSAINSPDVSEQISVEDMVNSLSLQNMGEHSQIHGQQLMNIMVNHYTKIVRTNLNLVRNVANPIINKALDKAMSEINNERQLTDIAQISVAKAFTLLTDDVISLYAQHKESNFSDVLTTGGAHILPPQEYEVLIKAITPAHEDTAELINQAIADTKEDPAMVAAEVFDALFNINTIGSFDKILDKYKRLPSGKLCFWLVAHHLAAYFLANIPDDVPTSLTAFEGQLITVMAYGGYMVNSLALYYRGNTAANQLVLDELRSLQDHPVLVLNPEVYAQLEEANIPIDAVYGYYLRGNGDWSVSNIADKADYWCSVFSDEEANRRYQRFLNRRQIILDSTVSSIFEFTQANGDSLTTDDYEIELITSLPELHRVASAVYNEYGADHEPGFIVTRIVGEAMFKGTLVPLLLDRISILTDHTENNVSNCVLLATIQVIVESLIGQTKVLRGANPVLTGESDG